MSQVVVMPSAPHEDSHVYPQLQHDFRMQKANNISRCSEQKGQPLSSGCEKI